MKHFEIDEKEFDILKDESFVPVVKPKITLRIKDAFKPKPKSNVAIDSADEPSEPVSRKKTITELAIEQAQQKLDKEKQFVKPTLQPDSFLSPSHLMVPDPIPAPVSTPPLGATVVHQAPLEVLLPEQAPPVPKVPFYKRLFSRKKKEKKEVAPKEVKQHVRYRMVDSSILLFAFLIGAVSIILVYHELPTHPYLVIGIAGISVSVGIITGINRW